MPDKLGVLAVGNFDSNVGYAWRLMERLWCQLAGYFGERDYAMYVCFPTISAVPDCLKVYRFHVDQLDFSDTSFTGIMAQCRYLKRCSIKVLYLTDFGTFSFRYILYRLVGVRTIIVHDHTPGLRARPSIIKRYLKRLFNELPLISSSANFAVSPYVQKRLIEVDCVPPRKAHCVTNGIAPDLPPPKKAIESPITIVTVARANYYKGIDFALYVMKELVKELGEEQVRYVLLGDGPDLADFKQLANNLKLEDVVTFAGAVDDVPERLLHCEIAFHPSQGEAMSLAILEYMRAGLPVVAPDNPSVSSALKHDQYALIYPQKDVGEAAAALANLITEPEKRTRLGEEARHQLETQFSDTAMNERFLLAIKGVMEH